MNNIYYFFLKCVSSVYDNPDKENLTADNAEYILRSSKYHKVSYKISEKNNEEIKFIRDKLHKKSIV